MIILDNCVEQSKKARVQAEQNNELVREYAKDPKGFNSKFKADRIQKCPACGGDAISEEPGAPYICKCGWQSNKPNGGIQ
jgi:hypothetical protein